MVNSKLVKQSSVTSNGSSGKGSMKSTGGNSPTKKKTLKKDEKLE
jgi:hypothetical protein